MLCALVALAAAAAAVPIAPMPPEVNPRALQPPAPSAAAGNDTDGLPTAFILAHAHADPGWRIPIEEYYETQVREILNSVVDELLADAGKRFVWAEMSFFSLFWAEQSDDRRFAVADLVRSGRFEILLGGWAMSDEALVDPFARIHMMTLGHEFVLDTFGIVPRIGWQIDPFGASSMTATLFSRYGFDAWVNDRISLKLKEHRKHTQELQYLWQGSPSAGRASEIFTHTLDSWYWSPAGYSWDEGDAPVTNYTLHSRAVSFANMLKMRESWFRTRHILFPWGHDFSFQNGEGTGARLMYESMDQLVDYINADPEQFGIHVRYGTPSEFFAAVNAEFMDPDKDLAIPEFPDQDYLPFEDIPWGGFWTGFFTSRPYLKGLTRRHDALKQSAEALFATAAAVRPGNYSRIDHARQISGIMTHHDAITGTSRQLVVDDYVAKLLGSLDGLYRSLEDSVGALLGREDAGLEVHHVDRDSVVDLAPLAAGGPGVVVVVHNPLGWASDHPVSLCVSGLGERALRVAGAVAQLGPALPGDPPAAEARLLLQANGGVAPLDLFQIVVDVVEAGADGAVPVAEREEAPWGGDPVIEGAHYAVEFSGESGLVARIRAGNATDGVWHRAEQGLLQYRTFKSGAYLFAPDGEAESLGPAESLAVWRGPLAETAVQTFAGNWHQTVTVYRGLAHVELLVGATGPIEENREVIMRFATDIANTDGEQGAPVFFTDNGLEMRRRQIDAESWPSQVIESNYMPIINSAVIGDADRQLAVISTQPHGACSLGAGELEVMLQRRTMQDDNMGMNQPMDEQSPFVARFALLLGNVGDVDGPRHALAQRANYPLVALVGERSDEVAAGPTRTSPIKGALPESIHLASYMQRRAGGADQDIVVRLAHLWERDIPGAQEETVAFDDIFAAADGRRVVPRSLTLNQSRAGAQGRRMQWRRGEGDDGSDVPLDSSDERVVVMRPVDMMAWVLEALELEHS